MNALLVVYLLCGVAYAVLNMTSEWSRRAAKQVPMGSAWLVGAVIGAAAALLLWPLGVLALMAMRLASLAKRW